MQPVDERNKTNITSSFSKSKYNYNTNLASNVDDLREYKPSIQIEYKKRRNKMKNFIPKKNKRK